MRDLDWRSFDVLVVDDEEDNLDAFRFAFRKSFNLHYALGGPQALQMLDRLDPAVVVSDQRMPGMNGIEFLKRAKERRPDTVGVLLTAYADLAVLIDAVNSGAVDRYIQKPWDSKELTVVLRQAITVAKLRQLSLAQALEVVIAETLNEEALARRWSRLTTIERAVARAVLEEKPPFAAASLVELGSATGKSVKSHQVQNALLRLEREGFIERGMRGGYAIADPMVRIWLVRAREAA